ncbi:sulfonate transport system permease protein [Homoserinimonas aerilata]|uniref:Sulfonate transport system permease protein n=1 Tax=Homoserinimonas aerilata TaxID=1162970 RepID=A0A542YIQ2_9MICO|nr:ABC transporter permease [Homoserinimonas aerilata]TQL47970.1 sulfonate transport system permease protein [Homoserinimonas aerilata]
MTVTTNEKREPAAEPSATLHQYVSGYGYSAAGTEANSQPKQPGRRRSRSWWIVLAGFVIPIAALAAWYLATEYELVPTHRMPSPERVVTAAISMIENGTLATHIAISTQRVLLGFVFGAVAGLVLGSIVGLSRWGSAFLSPSIGALRAVPSLAWVPLLLLYLGIGEDSKVTLIAIGALFPVFTTVAGSLRHVDRQLVELGRAYGLTRLELLAQVQLPAVIPSIVSGLRLALAQAWLFLVAAELLASSRGLGFLLNDSQNNGRIDRLFLTIILLGILGKTTDALIGLLEKYLLKRWG